MNKKKSSSKKNQDIKPNPSEECVIPPAIPLESLSDFIVGTDDKGLDDVIRYMEGQVPDEKIKHAEKVKSEKILGTKYDVWDVATDKGRWWVITELMNLYPQNLFPSLDYTLSFHIGLMQRLISRETPENNQDIFASAWRKWEQAARAAEDADEPEEYQAVGMRCREALIAFIKEAANPEIAATAKTIPKAGDFQGWIQILVDIWAPGSSSKELRSFLKNTSKSTWQLVNWLTHTTHASKYEAEIATSATENTMLTLFLAFTRHSKGLPGKCGICGSYQIARHYWSDAAAYQDYCRGCGWEGELEPVPQS